MRGADANLGWEVRYTEHRWDHPRTGAHGFIDIVLQHRSLPTYVVVECKRVQDSEWTFLRPRGSMPVVRSKVLIRYMHPTAVGRSLTGWEDVTANLDSAESGFCILPGEGDSKNRPMLERVATELVASVEGLVAEDEDNALHQPNTPYTYIAMIVTTAELKLCEYDESKIDIATGVFGDASISDIEFVRFRKQLAGAPSTVLRNVRGFSSRISTAKESTVYVVNVNHLGHFLRYLSVDETSLQEVVRPT